MPEPGRRLARPERRSFDRRLGPAKIPPYVRITELNSDGTGFLEVHHLQISAPGDRPLLLDRELRYFWVIDRELRLRIAPKTFFTDGAEAMGHVNLTGGKLVKIGGELYWDGSSEWVFDTDSGRAGHKQPEIRRENLDAAVELLLRVGLVERSGSRVEAVRTKWKTPLHESPEQADRIEAAWIADQIRSGGYTILPPRGRTFAEACNPNFRDAAKREQITMRLRRSLLGNQFLRSANQLRLSSRQGARSAAQLR
jgi:hypothetical protein